MRVFQVVRDGKRICRIFVNCRATSAEIADGLLVAVVEFRSAARWEKVDKKEYCGMASYELRSMLGAFVEVYEVEEGGVDD